jgi:hypothetical protein
MSMNNPFASDFSATASAFVDAYMRSRQQAMEEQRHDRELAFREQEAQQRADEHAWNLKLKQAEYESKIAERDEKARLEREKRGQADGAARAIARASDLPTEAPAYPGLAGYGMMQPPPAMGGWADDETAGPPVEAPYMAGPAGAADIAVRGLARQQGPSPEVQDIAAALLSNRPGLSGELAQVYQKRRATQVKSDLGVGRLDLDWFRARQKNELDWAALELRRKQWEARARRGGSGMGKDWPKYMAAGQAFVQRGQRAEALAQADFDDATKGFTMKDMLGNYTGVQRILSPEERQQKMAQAKAALDEAKSFYDQSDEFFRAGTTRAGVGRVERPGKKSPSGATTAATSGVTAPAPAAPKRPPGIPANLKWNPQAQAWLP